VWSRVQSWSHRHQQHFYADDICLLFSSIKALEIMLYIFEKYAYEHDLKFNPKKTVYQCFCDRSYDLTRPFVRFCGKVLQWRDTVQYLGFEVNCNDRDFEELIDEEENSMQKPIFFTLAFTRVVKMLNYTYSKTIFLIFIVVACGSL